MHGTTYVQVNGGLCEVGGNGVYGVNDNINEGLFSSILLDGLNFQTHQVMWSKFSTCTTTLVSQEEKSKPNNCVGYIFFKDAWLVKNSLRGHVLVDDGMDS